MVICKIIQKPLFVPKAICLSSISFVPEAKPQRRRRERRGIECIRVWGKAKAKLKPIFLIQMLRPWVQSLRLRASPTNSRHRVKNSDRVIWAAKSATLISSSTLTRLIDPLLPTRTRNLVAAMKPRANLKVLGRMWRVISAHKFIGVIHKFLTPTQTQLG